MRGEPAIQFLFRHRGLVPVLPAIYALAFAHPRPPLIAGGAALMAAGEGLRLWGAAHLGRTARSRRPRAGKLVTTGPYAHTRHPLYQGNFALAVGFAVLSGAGWPWFPAGVAAAFLVLYRLHAEREEAALAAAFPEAWAAYRDTVPAAGWRLRAARASGAGPAGERSWGRALRVEALTLNAEAWAVAAVWARTRWLG